MQTAEDFKARIRLAIEEIRAGDADDKLAAIRDDLDDAAFEEDDEDGPLQQLLAEMEEADMQSADEADWAEALGRALQI